MAEEPTTGWGGRQIVWLLLLVALSLAGNVWAPRLFTGFNYLLGSVGVLLVLRLFGLAPALVTALLAAAWCKQLFGHYYPLLWLGLEPLFVWYWCRRRPRDSMIMADTVYWAILGGPLILYVFLALLGVTPLGTGAATLMYATIGITNALVATLLLTQLPLARWVWPDRRLQLISLDQLIFQVLMLAIVLPALLVLVSTGRDREEMVTRQLADSLEIKARQAGYEFRQKVFMGFFPETFNGAERNSLQPDRIVALLKSLQGEQHLQLHLLVNKGEVIASTDPRIHAVRQYDPLQRGNALQTGWEQLFHVMPPNNPPVPLWQRAGKSSYVRIHRIPKTVFYTIAETSFGPYQANILKGHRNALAGLLLYLAAGTLLATIVARRIAVPLTQLSKTTTDLPGRLMSEDLHWPESRIVEVQQLVENAQEMAHTLSGQFREIAQINAELEQRVAERTRELSDTNESLRQEIDERISAERQRDHLMDELTMQLRFLQMLIDAIPNPIYFKDTAGRYQGFNRAFGEALGLERDQVVGKTAEDIYPAAMAAYFRAKDGELLAVGGVQQYETDIVYADGSNRTLIVCKAAYQGLSGDRSGLIGVFLDITERKLSELERDRLMKELEAKNKELESIIYVSSHDLRSPLVNIQGFSRKVAKNCATLVTMLEELQLPEEQQQEALKLLTDQMPRSIAFITSSVEKMDGLLAGLLKLSRLGRAAINIENLDMNQLMGKITNSLAYQIEGVDAAVTIAELLPCQGDGVQVSQVFTNLLDNAIKYRAADRRLEIMVTSQTSEHGIEYCVQDNGIGIPPEYQSQIWEIFHRINPRDIPGEGLGLTVSRRILDRLNGSIRVESEEGVGSRFLVVLPAQRN